MPETITFLTVLREGKSPRAGQGLLKLEGEQEKELPCDKKFIVAYAKSELGSDSDQPKIKPPNHFRPNHSRPQPFAVECLALTLLVRILRFGGQIPHLSLTTPS